MFGLFRMPRFIRRFIRRKTARMPEAKALEIKEKLSIAYAFVAWNLFGYMAYMVYSGRWTKQEKEDKEPELSTGRHFAKLLKLRNVELTHVHGLSYVQTYDLTEEEGFVSDKVKENDEVKQIDEVKQDEELLEE